MANPVLPRHNFTPNAVPIAASEISAPGELVINWADGVAYTKDSAGNLISWSLGGGSGGGGGEDALLRSIFVPPAPTGLTATAGNAQVTLSWTAPTGVIAQAPITDYRKQYSTNGGTTWTTFSSPVSTATIATVTGLTNGTAYVFRVAAMNAVGVGAYTAASSSVTPVAFAPTYIAGLQLWTDASDASTLFDATSGGSLVAADGGVARWQDKSGNARHFTQATSGSRPLRRTARKNNRDILEFDGFNDFMSIASSTAAFRFLHGSSSGYTAFAVVSPRALNTRERIWETGNSGSPAGDSGAIGADWTIAANGSIRYDAANGATRVIANVSNTSLIAASGWYVCSVSGIANSGTASLRSSIRINGGTAIANNLQTGTAGSGNSRSDLIIARGIGHNGDGSVEYTEYADLDIAEIIIYDSALSDANRGLVESYLMNKWGIS